MQLVAVDLVGPFPTSQDGNCYLLVAMDYFTKWGEAYAVLNMEASTVADTLTNEMFFRFSPPESVNDVVTRWSPGCDGIVNRLS